MTEFTDKDREFIVKIAKTIDDYKKATDVRLDKLEGKDNPVVSPIQRKEPVIDDTRFRRDIPFGEFEEGESIQITFKGGNVDSIKYQVLVESIYMTLKKLCEDNNIEQLLIKIDN